MDTQSIAVITAILTEGSFQKAAQRLNCSQSTITFQVRRLENELSLPLFERIGRRMVLSRAGKDILPHMQAIAQAMQEIREYSDGQGHLAGELRLAVAESLLACKLAPVITRFMEKAPDVRLELHSRNCHDIRTDLVAGRYDMGIYYDVGGHPHCLDLTTLGETSGVIAASPALSPAIRDMSTPHQCKEISFITSEARSVYRERMEAYLRAQDIRLRNTVELWNIEAIKQCVARTPSITFLPRFAVDRELQEGQLLELPAALSRDPIRIICVRHRNRRPGAAERLFHQMLVDEGIFSQKIR